MSTSLTNRQGEPNQKRDSGSLSNAWTNAHTRAGSMSHGSMPTRSASSRTVLMGVIIPPSSSVVNPSPNFLAPPRQPSPPPPRLRRTRQPSPQQPRKERLNLPPVRAKKSGMRGLWEEVALGLARSLDRPRSRSRPQPCPALLRGSPCPRRPRQPDS